MSGVNLVVAIPTYRRRRQLAELLDSLQGELDPANSLIVVADNDPDSSARSVVEGYRQGWPPISYITVPERGVSHVRNALVAESLRAAPNWQWLAMLDDDGLATPGWLSAIRGCGEMLSADIVGGPVVGILPPGSNILARNSIFASRRRWPTGLVPTLNTTQNILLSRHLLTIVPFPLFQAQYSASGGEDYDLFRRAAKAGARIGWCDEAVVKEPAPSDRLGYRAVLFRYFSTGAYAVQIDCGYDGHRATAFRVVKGLASSGFQILTSLLRLNFDKAAGATLTFSHFIGRLCGLLGTRTARYVKPVGK